MLTGNSSLAKVSGTPGKTRLINHFKINNEWYLVDLPGYGYARTSKSMREAFSKIIKNYITKCEKLYMLFVLVDSRHEPQRVDVEFMEMLGEEGIPFGVIFTKFDKLNTVQRKRNIETYQTRLLEQWEELPPIFKTSAEKGTGREELLAYIGECIAEIKNN